MVIEGREPHTDFTLSRAEIRAETDPDRLREWEEILTDIIEDTRAFQDAFEGLDDRSHARAAKIAHCTIARNWVRTQFDRIYRDEPPAGVVVDALLQFPCILSAEIFDGAQSGWFKLTDGREFTFGLEAA